MGFGSNVVPLEKWQVQTFKAWIIGGREQDVPRDQAKAVQLIREMYDSNEVLYQHKTLQFELRIGQDRRKQYKTGVSKIDDFLGTPDMLWFGGIGRGGVRIDGGILRLKPKDAGIMLSEDGVHHSLDFGRNGFVTIELGRRLKIRAIYLG